MRGVCVGGVCERGVRVVKERCKIKRCERGV